MPARIVVAGGGVAAMEAVAALRALAGAEPAITVIAPAPTVEQRPLSVTVPFAGAPPPSVSLSELSARAGFELHLGSLESVDPDEHQVRLGAAEAVPYDKVVVAVGAVPNEPFPGAITFAGVADAPAVSEALESGGQIAFVCPLASGWTLPIYELALMAKLSNRDSDVAVVTAEATPLWIFGVEAEDAVRSLLASRGISLLTGVRVLAAADGKLELADAEPVSADWAIALPLLSGPAIAGLPQDDQGFIPVDAHGAVTGVADVYAAGDGTTFPLKQGGLAAEQADAVAESIAASLGAPVTPEPFEPILRGLLLTGDEAIYLRSDGTRGSSGPAAHTAVSGRALWWPPAKVAGRYLAPLLAGEEPVRAERLRDLPGPEGGHEAEPEDPSELALLVAQEDALRGDYERALQALDTAEALAGAKLAPEWERARTMWAARTEWPSP